MKAKNILKILAVTAAVAALMFSVLSGLDLSALRALYSEAVPEGIRQFIWDVRLGYSQPLVYLVVLAAFVLERILPADRKQPMFHAGLAQDFFWFNVVMLTSWTFIAAYSAFLGEIYDRYFSFLTIQSAENRPVWTRAVVSLLVFDFLRWFHHFLKHKIRYIWFFHEIHHSQTRMNFFTNQRIHIAESLFAHSVIFIPMFIRLRRRPRLSSWG